ncbi:MAG: hypothetical protein AAFZ18_38465 [Myxococcota bacterium]
MSSSDPTIGVLSEGDTSRLVVRCGGPGKQDSRPGGPPEPLYLIRALMLLEPEAQGQPLDVQPVPGLDLFKFCHDHGFVPGPAASRLLRATEQAPTEAARELMDSFDPDREAVEALRAEALRLLEDARQHQVETMRRFQAQDEAPASDEAADPARRRLEFILHG